MKHPEGGTPVKNIDRKASKCNYVFMNTDKQDRRPGSIHTVLREPRYKKMFSAQIIALLGTGIATVALALLAEKIAGNRAGAVMGIALTVKMFAYVAVAPVTTALTSRLPKKPVLITADAARALVALALPFVNAEWQIYAIIFVLQAASATFTPTFQAIIPDILPNENDYTKALSLSRLAYDTEALVSPVLAGLALFLIPFTSLFLFTSAGFIASALLVLKTQLPQTPPTEQTAFFTRLTLGAREFWRHKPLRAILALNLSIAAAVALVLVNTVVIVQHGIHGNEQHTTIILAIYGLGSMTIALTLPRLLQKLADMPVMLTGAAALTLLMIVTSLTLQTNPQNLHGGIQIGALWLGLGAAGALVQVPLAKVLRRHSTENTRPAVFAAQFSLSHACFIITYPLAGIGGELLGTATSTWTLTAVTLTGFILATATIRKTRTGKTQNSFYTHSKT